MEKRTLIKKRDLDDLLDLLSSKSLKREQLVEKKCKQVRTSEIMLLVKKRELEAALEELNRHRPVLRLAYYTSRAKSIQKELEQLFTKDDDDQVIEILFVE